MTETTPQRPLASRAQLLKSTAVAAVIAVVIIVCAVLPAERGVDPTGLGALLGLKAMGELKNAAHVDAHAADPSVAVPPVATRAASADAGALAASAAWSDQIAVTLEPNQGAEVKAVLQEGGELNYTWSVDDGFAVSFDFHGEPKGAAKDVFTSFEKGSSAASEGSFVAPFEGTHGWYGKNRGTKPVTIRVKTSGDYSKVSRTM